MEMGDKLHPMIQLLEETLLAAKCWRNRWMTVSISRIVLEEVWPALL